MSRCFPFPPPGYEKKARTDDVDLLKKEKHKEKKHKKEKKDKEKREGKDGKDKDKSDGKHRDKKDRKEKSKEKKKDKEREKETGKACTSQEKKIPAEIENCKGDPKLNHKEREGVKVQNVISNENKQGTPFRGLVGERPVEKSLFNEGAMDKFVLDLCGRIKDEEKGSASQSLERIPFTGRSNHDRMVNNKTEILSMEKEKKKEQRVDDVRKMDGQGVRVGAAISDNVLVQNTGGKEKIEIKGVDIKRGFQNRAEEIPRFFDTNNETRDKFLKDRSVDDIRKMDGHAVRVGGAISARTLVQNIVAKQKIENRAVSINGGFENRADEVSRILEKSIEPRDKNHKKESEDKRGSKRSDKDKEKKSHGKDKEREREKKKEKKAKEKSEKKIQDAKDSIKNGHIVGQTTILPPLVPDGDRSLVFGQNIKLPQLVPDGDRNLIFGTNTKLLSSLSNGDRNLVSRQNMKLPQPVSDGNRNLVGGQNTRLPSFSLDDDRNPAVEGNFRKRKDIDANGFLHGESLLPRICDETNVVPNKKSRPTPHPWIENGRKLEPCQASVLDTPDRQGPPPNNLIKVNNTEHKVNGKIEVQPMSNSLKKPSSSSSSSSSKSKVDPIAQAIRMKPPHPDTKYLSEILSVPKIEELCDFDDEEWLFARKDHASISAGPTTKASETPIVWAEAMQIESADVCALPYVIPY